MNAKKERERKKRSFLSFGWGFDPTEAKNHSHRYLMEKRTKNGRNMRQRRWVMSAKPTLNSWVMSSKPTLNRWVMSSKPILNPQSTSLWKHRQRGKESETSHPRIAHGQRYPMPCLEWSTEEVEWEQGSGPKGPMSCRTQGWISRRPEKAH